MEIKQEDNGRKGRFYVDEEKGKAEMSYIWAGPEKIIIDHTAVDDAFRGMGVGEKLVRASVDFARAKGIKIMPLCPFANSIFKKRLELRDVL